MSRYGLVVAGQYAQGLPAFRDIEEAKRSLFAARDRAIEEILSVPELVERLDFSPASLSALESWYFASQQPVSFPSGFSVAHAIGFYFGEVFVRSAGFTWVVDEFVFQPGRYEIGVRRPLVGIMLTKGKLPKTSGNKKMQSLLREFNRYAP